VFAHAVDRYSGVTVPDSSLAHLDGNDVSAFASLLTSSLARWAELKRRGLWIQIPVHQSAFIAAAAKEGFECHHAQPGYVMMTCWLPERMAKLANQAAGVAEQSPKRDGQQEAAAATIAAGSSAAAAVVAEPSMIPAYATHSLGIGCAVLNSKGQLLVIQERFSHPLLPDFFKLPGGAVDAGEELPAAAEREVWEETGVRCTFRSIVGFRHLINFRFGCGDLYFIAVCQAEEGPDGTIPAPTPQPEEISACKWMDLQDFLHFHSSRWMQDLIREPLLQEWGKIFPGKALPPPPSPERIAELGTYPPHPKASEGKSYPVVVPPQPPSPGGSVAMRYTRMKGLLNSAESNFYVVTPPNQAQLRGEAAQAAQAALAQASAASSPASGKQQ